MKKTPAVLATLGAAALLAVAAPLAASAHVSLTSNTAEAGSYTLLTFKVPNESATATTDSVTIHLPTDTPFESVSYVPTPGWTAAVTTTAKAVPTTVVFTADADSSIADGQLQLFTLSVGPVPDVDSVPLTVSQHYSDDSVVEWSDTSADAEEPAPVLYINAAPPADHHGGAAATVEAHDETDDSDAATSSNDGDVLARVLGIGGLVVGAVGIVLAVTARRATR